MNMYRVSGLMSAMGSGDVMKGEKKYVEVTDWEMRWTEQQGR